MNSLTTGDKILIGVVVAFGIGSIFWVRNEFLELSSGNFQIYKEGKLIMTIPKNKDSIYSFHVRTGEIKIEIRNGSARIINSPCREKICQHMGSINKSDESIVCLPNKFVVCLPGPKKTDATTR